MEVEERVRVLTEANSFNMDSDTNKNVVKGVTGEYVEVMKAPDLLRVKELLQVHPIHSFKPQICSGCIR